MGKEEAPGDVEVFTVAQLSRVSTSDCSAARASYICSDAILSKVRQYTRKGLPDTVRESLKPYWNRRTEFTVEGSCVLWGIRVIVPRKLQNQVLVELHFEHSGVVRMKSIDRNHMWWPGIDKQLEELVKLCDCCQSVKSSPAPVDQRHCIPGFGRHSHGREFTSILQDLSSRKCS